MSASWHRVASLLGLSALVAAAASAAQAGARNPEVRAELAAAAAAVGEAPELAAEPTVPPRKAVSDIVFFSDFDTDDGGLSGNLDWQWGTSYAWTGGSCYNAMYANPPAPFSGAGMWGTILNDCYSNLSNNQGAAASGGCVNTAPSDDSILSLTVDLSGYAAATLSWYEWYDVFSYWDWAELRVNDSSELLHCEPSHVTPTAWVQQVVDLSAFVGGTVTLEWHFMSSSVVNYAGWYLDDVMVDGTPLDVELVGTVSSAPALADPAGTTVEAAETTGGTLVASTTTNSSGAFALDLPSDEYEITVSRAHYLWGVTTQVVVAGTTVTLPAVTILGGDMNADDTVNIVDVSSIAIHFGTTDPAGDLNEDGTVNIVDIAGAAANLGQSAPVPW